jgi:hypothetical protein
MMIKVLGWTDRPVIAGSEIDQRWKNVTDALTDEKAAAIWDAYVAGVMKGKNMEFNPDTFWRMADLLAPLYFIDTQSKNAVLRNLWWKEDSASSTTPPSGGSLVDPEMRKRPFFTVDGKTWTVGDFETAIASHPLVFRNRKMKRKEFPEQLRFAVADLIRDEFLNREAYRKRIDSAPAVRQNEAMWNDSFMARFERNRILASRDSAGASTELWMRSLREVIEPHTDSLYRKYDGRIQINLPAFEKLQLTRIDMVVRYQGQPYPETVPDFPAFTTRNRMDYGRKME